MEFGAFESKSSHAYVELKNCWCINEPKRYNIVLIVTIADIKHNFPFVFFLDIYIIIGFFDINFSKELNIRNAI